MTLEENVKIGYALGWSFTPLVGKRPVLPGWNTRPRASLEEVLDWIDRGLNIGLRTGAASGVFVVDVDKGAGALPFELPPTVTVRTPGGGWHFYFKQPPGMTVPNSASAVAPHVDVKGDDGQVVYPGSIHPDTQTEYTWLDGHGPEETAVRETLRKLAVASCGKEATP
jgi:putative DNA primase/helicase